MTRRIKKEQTRFCSHVSAQSLPIKADIGLRIMGEQKRERANAPLYLLKTKNSALSIKDNALRYPREPCKAIFNPV